MIYYILGRDIMVEKRTEEGYKKKKEYTQRYIKENKYTFSLSLNKKYDEEIINHLKKLDNKQKYIKDLIIEDMKKEGK